MKLIKQNKWILKSVIGMIFVGFSLLSVGILIFPNPVIDREFSLEVQEHSNPTLDSFMSMISWLGYMPYSPVLVVLVASLFLVFKYRREALFILLTLISGVVSTAVKLVVNRNRPSSSLVRVIEKTRQQSFPSGHVLFYIVFFGFLILLMYRIPDIPKSLRVAVAGISFFLIFTIPFSRIYLGAHWFTDVLGGFLLGVLVLYGLSYFYLKQPDGG